MLGQAAWQSRMHNRVRYRLGCPSPDSPARLFDLLRQLAIWFGFLHAYRYTQGHRPGSVQAFHNGLAIADVEHRFIGLWELSLQSFRRLVGRPPSRGDSVDVLALPVHRARPVAPVGLSPAERIVRPSAEHASPRERHRPDGLRADSDRAASDVPELGFVDTLAGFGINHDSAIVRADANPYAAMPSLHAADALIIGVALAFLVRSRWLKALWLLWPAWVWFSVMATGNHFWLDILAGILLPRPPPQS